MSGPNAHFDAWAALVGHGIPRTSDVLVDSGAIKLTHPDAFAARAPIEETRYPSRPFEDDDPNFRAKFRQTSYCFFRPDASEGWLTDETTSAKFLPCGRAANNLT